MAGEHALPDLVSRIKVDSSGLDSAMSNLVASFGRANLALAGVAAGVGLLIVGGKSMIDISEKHAAATLGLEQAYKSAGADLTKYQRNIDDFLMSSRRYTSDQSEVLDGFAKLTRSGLTQTEVQKDMSRAVDLAALKHISLSEAVTLLDNAEHGRMRGLIDLGITTGKYTDAQGNLIKSSHSVAQAMAELDTKLKGGRDTLTSLQQHSNQLSNDWQDLSNKGGPVLLTLLDFVITKITGVYDAFDRIGKDDKLWATISDRLVKMASWIHTYVIAPLVDLDKWIKEHPMHYGGVAEVTKGLASGGPVLPGHIYTVGESGPETFMSDVPGRIIPNGGAAGNTYHYNYNLSLSGASAVDDPEAVRRMLQRMALMGAAG